ncbi:LD-carboxypeptidase [Arthrobacter crusticola]|uniref:LD-carboxypeptidase n=1 Tax=Arthrobacter crusticola TaxID=2547960 RepID=A0A4V6PLS0_9MICC|nr:S66 peptidase family protein [Arthrobacter crusticola]TDK27974.1 LD-carboxypeptidase [Arthrobacter crusticola]
MNIWGPTKAASKLRKGDRVAVLSPSFAAPGFAPAVHEQAMTRFAAVTGLVPVEFPTTRRLGASAEDRAADLNAAFADPTIRAILATVGGDDQITVIPHLDADLARADPKLFLGYSDNTNLLNWLWSHGIGGFYGGSTQVHLGPGPGIDEVHLASLQAALMAGGELTITDPGESEDFGQDWRDPRALVEFGEREPTEPWVWAGPKQVVSGRTWGGCLEVLDQLALADHLPPVKDLHGAILLLETSEELPPADWVKRWVRALGERGILDAVDAVLVARPPTSSFELRPGAAERSRLRAAQRDAVIEQITRYNPGAVICVGVPFGHTRPQWILPYGGNMTMNGLDRTITAHYG